MDKYLSKTRAITAVLFASFGIMGNPDLGVLAATSKLNSQPDEMALNAQYEAEIAGMTDADAAYLRKLREHFD